MFCYRTRLPALAGLFLFALLMAGGATAQETDNQVTLAFRDADLSTVISTVADLTGRNFIVDPRVKGKVTVISSRPMNADEVYQVFLAILNVHGFSVVPGPEASKIVPVVNAKQDAIPTVDERRPGRGDQYVTRVIQVQNVPVAQLVPILRPLLPQQGHLAAYPPSNVLIASGEAANVSRLADIIDRIDVAGDEDIEIIRLDHASASDTARILESLLRAAGQDQPQEGAPTIVADERTNSLLVSGSQRQRLRLRTLATHLDTPLERGGNTEVIYLRYAKAADTVEVLRGLIDTLPGAREEERTEVSIQADVATNAIVISAQPSVIQSLRSVINQLDIRRAQVLVEAIIAEVSSTAERQLGVQWGVDGSGEGEPVALVNFGIADAIQNPLAAIGTGFNLLAGDTTGRSPFGVFVRALAADSDSNILSTPSLLTLDNETAEIVVGQNVPFVTGSYAGTGQGVTPTTPFQTIERRDVGVTLRITPQINEGDAVRLEVEQEVSSVAFDPNAVDLVTNMRSIRTSVLVDDGQVVVLGGLMDDDLQETSQRVPLLGDIPILGHLFRFQRTQKVKRNLMVFLHPVILRDAVQNNTMASRKYNHMRAQQLRTRERGVALMHESVSPLMPEFDRLLELPPPFVAPAGN